jgi:hypothetical protein
MINNFFDLMDKIVSYLNETNYICESSDDDGRVNSTSDDRNVMEMIKKAFPDNVILPEGKRQWYDFLLKIDDQLCPGNFKSTKAEKNQKDNASAIKQLVYCFTDLPIENITTIKGQSKYQEALIDRRSSSEKDYLYLVYDKSKNCFFSNSLKRLSEVVPNGSNLPFQIGWGEKSLNRTPLDKTEQEAYNLLIGTYKKSIKKAMEMHKRYEEL